MDGYFTIEQLVPGLQSSLADFNLALVLMPGQVF